jgi:hypothetical protein
VVPLKIEGLPDKVRVVFVEDDPKAHVEGRHGISQWRDPLRTEQPVAPAT